MSLFGGVAQWLEYLSVEQKVASSNLAAATNAGMV
jgi:hypothetical protein